MQRFEIWMHELHSSEQTENRFTISWYLSNIIMIFITLDLKFYSPCGCSTDEPEDNNILKLDGNMIIQNLISIIFPVKLRLCTYWASEKFDKKFILICVKSNL